MTVSNHRSSALSHQKCFNHAHREAAARCLECSRFFCRECVTEHEGKVICAKCLEAQTHTATTSTGFGEYLVRLGVALCGLIVIWAVFYYLGEWLLESPSKFHDGTIWH